MKNVILKNVNIYDGTLNMVLKENQNIEITNGKISKIGNFDFRKKYKIIDLKGKFVIPGLINLHSHLPSSGNLSLGKLGDRTKLANFVSNNFIGRKIGIMLGKKAAATSLRSGVTTVRTVGGISNLDSLLRDKINSKNLSASTLVASNLAIGVKGGHMDGTVAHAISNNNEAIDFIDKLKKENVDLIKIMITGGVLDGEVPGQPAQLKMSRELVRCCCEHAHKLGLKVAAHVESKEGMDIAINEGVDSIEHGSYLDDKMAKTFKKRNGCVVLTLSPALPFALIPPTETGYGEIAKINTDIILKGMLECAKTCLSNGITLGLGTDAGSTFSTHYGFYKELIYFCKYCNVKPEFALHTATEVNSMILGKHDSIGTVEIGKDADLVILDNDPIKDLNALKDPKLIIKRGKIIKNLKIKHFDLVDKLIDEYVR